MCAYVSWVCRGIGRRYMYAYIRTDGYIHRIHAWLDTYHKDIVSARCRYRVGPPDEDTDLESREHVN